MKYYVDKCATDSIMWRNDLLRYRVLNDISLASYDNAAPGDKGAIWAGLLGRIQSYDFDVMASNKFYWTMANIYEGNVLPVLSGIGSEGQFNAQQYAMERFIKYKNWEWQTQYEQVLFAPPRLGIPWVLDDSRYGRTEDLDHKWKSNFLRRINGSFPGLHLNYPSFENPDERFTFIVNPNGAFEADVNLSDFKLFGDPLGRQIYTSIPSSLPNVSSVLRQGLSSWRITGDLQSISPQRPPITYSLPVKGSFNSTDPGVAAEKCITLRFYWNKPVIRSHSQGSNGQTLIFNAEGNPSRYGFVANYHMFIYRVNQRDREDLVRSNIVFTLNALGEINKQIPWTLGSGTYKVRFTSDRNWTAPNPDTSNADYTFTISPTGNG